MKKKPADIPVFNQSNYDYINNLQKYWVDVKIVYLPYIFFKYLLLQLYSGQYKLGLSGLKLSVMVASYYSLLALYSKK